MVQTAAKLAEEVDDLLKNYLHLLDLYSKLQSGLKDAQSSIHQDIARANFSAERGVRYGEELYDARMQASRLCRITVPTHSKGPPEHGTTASTASFTLSTFAPHEEVKQTSDEAQQDKTEGESSAGVEDLKLKALQLDDEGDNGSNSRTAKDPNVTEKTENGKTNPAPNPLRMFGILTPPSLRTAQATSIEMVSNIVPEMVKISIQMKELEIQIGRKRKHKLKAKQQEAKDSKEGGGTPKANGRDEDSLQQLLTASIPSDFKLIRDTLYGVHLKKSFVDRANMVRERMTCMKNTFSVEVLQTDAPKFAASSRLYRAVIDTELRLLEATGFSDLVDEREPLPTIVDNYMTWNRDLNI